MTQVCWAYFASNYDISNIDYTRTQRVKIVHFESLIPSSPQVLFRGWSLGPHCGLVKDATEDEVSATGPRLVLCPWQVGEGQLMERIDTLVLSKAVGHVSWCPILMSNHCNSFDDWVPVDEIYGYSIVKWIAVTWQGWEGTRIVVQTMATKWHVLFCARDVIVCFCLGCLFNTIKPLFEPVLIIVPVHWTAIAEMCKKKSKYFTWYTDM